MKYGLIGEKLSHSYSLSIHGFFGNNDYVICPIATNELDSFMTKRDFKGINVTIPYKKEVMKYCVLSDEAKEIGAVNTIINRNGTLYGYNTDAMGFKICANKINLDFKDKKVLVLGTGGTCKTVSWVAKKEGAKEIILISRNGENNYENLYLHYDAEIIINTTPMGMYPNNSQNSIDITPFKRLCGVIDVVYNPLKTNLILQCEELGIPCTGGLAMLVGQALFAHNLYFDLDDLSPLQDSIKKATNMFRNIALIGMPGAGKTTTAKYLSKKLGLILVDTDEEILNKTNKTPAQIINENGEKAFRDIESEIIIEFSKKTGCVIATGGGAVLREENQKALRQNSTIIYLDTPIENLETEDRPLSKNLIELYNVRKPIYEKLSDFTINTDIGWGTVYDEIEKVLGEEL